MSSSYNTECELNRIAEDLFSKGAALQEAARILEILRNNDYLEEYKNAEKRAKEWMKK